MRFDFGTLDSGEWSLPFVLFFYQIFVKLAGNQDMHKISDKFEFRPDWISHFGVMRPWGWIKFSIDLWNLLHQLANLDKILCVASLRWGKGCVRFWSRFHQKCGCNVNRKLPLTCNGENHVSTLTPSVLTRSSSNLLVTRNGIKSWSCLNSGEIRLLPTELGAIDRLK